MYQNQKNQKKNLPQKIKDNLIPKYEKWSHIQKMLKQPSDKYGTPEALKDTFEYLLKQDNYYKGTKYEKEEIAQPIFINYRKN